MINDHYFVSSEANAFQTRWVRFFSNQGALKPQNNQHANFRVPLPAIIPIRDALASIFIDSFRPFCHLF